MLHYFETENLKRLIPIYNPQKNDFGLKLGNDFGHFPSSIYLKTLK